MELGIYAGYCENKWKPVLSIKAYEVHQRFQIILLTIVPWSSPGLKWTNFCPLSEFRHLRWHDNLHSQYESKLTISSQNRFVCPSGVLSPGPWAKVPNTPGYLAFQEASPKKKVKFWYAIYLAKIWTIPLGIGGGYFLLMDHPREVLRAFFRFHISLPPPPRISMLYLCIIDNV